MVREHRFHRGLVFPIREYDQRIGRLATFSIATHQLLAVGDSMHHFLRNRICSSRLAQLS